MLARVRLLVFGFKPNTRLKGVGLRVQGLGFQSLFRALGFLFRALGLRVLGFKVSQGFKALGTAPFESVYA